MKTPTKIAAALLSALAAAARPAEAAPPAAAPVGAPAPALVGPPADPAGTVLEDIELREVDLRDALGLISRETGLNLVASDEAAKKRVSLSLRNVTAKAAVQSLCEAHGLFFRLKDDSGIWQVSTAKEYQEGLTVFREERTRVFTLLYPNAIDLAVAVRDLFGDRVQLSLGREQFVDDADEVQRRFDVFDLLDQRSNGQGIFSGGSGGGGFGGGAFGGGGFGGGRSGIRGAATGRASSAAAPAAAASAAAASAAAASAGVRSAAAVSAEAGPASAAGSSGPRASAAAPGSPAAPTSSATTAISRSPRARPSPASPPSSSRPCRT
jgi:general secretion pathway protein D